MKRFTALRTAKIAAAITGPLMLLLWYLTFAYQWRSVYWLLLLLALMLITLSPSLCADPVAEDEAARARRGNDYEGLVIAASVLLGSGLVSPVYMIPLFVLFFLGSKSRASRAAPVAEDEAGRSRRTTFGLMFGIFALGLFYSWALEQPKAAAFFTALRPWLKDWRLIALMALLCLYLMRMSLRRALAFSMTDLYPHQRRAGKTEA